MRYDLPRPRRRALMQGRERLAALVYAFVLIVMLSVLLACAYALVSAFAFAMVVVQ